MDQVPHLSNTVQGIILFGFGAILFLNVTNWWVLGTKTILILASCGLMFFGFMKMDGYRKAMKLIKK